MHMKFRGTRQCIEINNNLKFNNKSMKEIDLFAGNSVYSFEENVFNLTIALTNIFFNKILYFILEMNLQTVRKQLKVSNGLYTYFP